ncbi:MAG: type II secretion system protein [Planctomycetota bacterium]
MTQPLSRRPAPGFSLVELLVVIGIIALLVGILLPVLSNARESAQSARCMSNMRQLTLAMTGYANDYNRQLPQPGNEQDFATVQQERDALWFNAVDYYLGNQISDGTVADRNYDEFKQDPSYLVLPITVGGTTHDDQNVRTYKMNIYFGHDGISGLNPTATAGNKAGLPFAFYRLTDVPQPSETFLIGDGRAHDTPATDGTIDADEFAMSEAFIGPRHSGETVNLAKVDSSVEGQSNPTRLTGAGYTAWFSRDTEPDETLWPDVIFNFRPESFGP